jgi:hypothetical protein
MSVSRREFLVAVALVPALAESRSPQSPGGWEAASVTRALPSAPVPAPAAASPIVSFHLDQPYLDLTGLQKPYVPPVGTRSGASLAALSEEEVLSRYYGFI